MLNYFILTLFFNNSGLYNLEILDFSLATETLSHSSKVVILRNHKVLHGASFGSISLHIQGAESLIELTSMI